jgi:cyclic pyranopterin phosphate synthase
VDVRFIEFMPFSGNNWEAKQQLIPYRDVLNGLHAEGLHLEALHSPDPHDTTKWFTQPDVHPTSSKVGFITSMSQHFCGACNRVRITADGRFRSCLFGKESDGFSLTEAFRSGSTDADLYGLVGEALGKKHASLGGHTVEKLGEKDMSDRPMILIGG